MIEKYGDIFNTEARYIGHGANCKGVMGAGIAKTIKATFPQNFERYKELCKTGMFQPGGFSAFLESGKVVVNFATQHLPGPNASYPLLFSALYSFSVRASIPDRLAKWDGICAIPELGCGIGGLEWRKVKKVIETVESLVPEVEYEVWHYQG